MKNQKGPNTCLPTVIIAFVTCQMALYFAPVIWAGENTQTKPESRADAVRDLVSHLGLGEGSVIADIGAGNGKDTWVFAEIVGETGKVFAEEIDEDKVKSLKDSAEKKNLAQVIARLHHVDALLGSLGLDSILAGFFLLVLGHGIFLSCLKDSDHLIGGQWKE